MEGSLLEAVCSLGVGAVLGLVIFFMYRRDRKASEDTLNKVMESHEDQLRQDRIFMEDRMTGIIERDQTSREANTEAILGLATALDKINGKR